MQTLTVSALVAHANPALVSRLQACALHATVARVDRAGSRDETRILAQSEAAFATCRDVLIERAEGDPAFVRPAHGQPARLRFGEVDRRFGHALVAELLRPAARPACADPDSARLLSLAKRIAATDATVLVLGGTGTGKEGMARYLHASSPRGGKDFIAVNCAALPDTMLEAMLFGHQKGSFTGAGAASEGLFRAADGGTLLLDEIAELPLALQAKLLRAIQEREVLPVGATRAVPIDVRLIAAANRDLAAEVAAGRFRADLYWRLNVLPLTLRPLAERPADVPAILAALMLRHTSAGEAFPWPTAPAIERLATHRWPGNVRELDNVVQRALLLRAGERLEVGDLALDHASLVADRPISIRADAVADPPCLGSGKAGSSIRSEATELGKVRVLSEISRSSESRAITEALAATGGNRIRAAGLLGISERTLRYRLAGIRAAGEERLAAA